MKPLSNRRRTWVGLCAFALPLLAAGQPYEDQPAPDRETMVRSVRQTVSRLVAAIDTGDASALRTLVYVERFRSNGIAQAQGLDALVQCVAAQRALEAAAREKFGDAAVALLGGDMRFSDAERKAIAEGPVEFREYTAVVILGPSVAPLELRWSRREGVWRVVVRAIQALHDDNGSRAPDPGSQTRIDRMSEVATVLRRVTERLIAGQFKTAADARRALDAGLSDSKVARR